MQKGALAGRQQDLLVLICSTGRIGGNDAASGARKPQAAPGGQAIPAVPDKCLRWLIQLQLKVYILGVLLHHSIPPSPPAINNQHAHQQPPLHAAHHTDRPLPHSTHCTACPAIHCRKAAL